MLKIDRAYQELKNWRHVRKINPNPIKDWPQEVVSQNMGCDRGVTICRYYVEKFIKDNSKDIVGDVGEIGDNTYTVEYGRANVTNSYIFTADKKYQNEKAEVIYGDLQNGTGCKNNILDCFICTQTLDMIFDVKSAAKNIVNMLKPGAVALITVSGISMISRYDDQRWGHYWSFTETSLRKLFDYDGNRVEITSFGNPKAAVACLYGLSFKELNKKDLEIRDELVPVVIGVRVVKN